MNKAIFLLSVFIGSLAGCQMLRRQAKIDEIKNLSDMATVEYTISKIIKYDDSAFYGRKKILFEVEAVVKAGVNFAKAEIVLADASAGRVHIRLPKPHVISIDMGADQIEEKYSTVGALRQNFDPEQKQKILTLGEEDLKKNIPQTGILDMAAQNARITLHEWLRLAGFGHIVIEQTKKNVQK